MENSRKSSSRNLLHRVADVLVPVVPEGATVLLGLSGGVDSVVLLHLLHQLSPQYSWCLSAFHVHHGISPRANEWAVFCTDLCAHYKIPFQLERVDIVPLRDLGVEAAARQLRHATLARQNADFIAFAHHQDDQVETLLLQLLRGAGVRGAAAMPFARRAAQIAASLLMEEGGSPRPPVLLRPLLNTSRAELLEYAAQYSLQWVEDESNADDAYPRNFLRHRVLPILEQRFPAYRATLARSARHFAEANALLDELAQQDGGLCASPTGEGILSLEVALLQSLSQSRAKNLMRYFLATRGAPMPDSVRLQEMLHQLCHARTDAALCVAFGDWEIRRYRGRVYALLSHPQPAGDPCIPWHGESTLELAALNGTLYFEPAVGQGVSLARLQQGKVNIHARRGGETIQPDAARPRRTLKNLLQERGIPPWQRDKLPLLFCGHDLVCVPGVVTEAAYQAHPGERGVLVSWRIRTA